VAITSHSPLSVLGDYLGKYDGLYREAVSGICRNILGDIGSRRTRVDLVDRPDRGCEVRDSGVSHDPLRYGWRVISE
jgi:hypothetical protein